MAWLSDFEKRIKFTIDNTNVNDTLSDFPVLVKLSDSSGISSTNVTSVFTELGSDANRKKIAVTTSDETTQCYVEIERFDYSNSEAELWVKVPTVVSGTTTDLYLYYDSTQAGNTTYVGDTGDTPAQNVWDSNFKLVMHMAQDPNGDVADAIKDSTSNADHGTPGGSMTTADLVDGKIGKGIDFDGGDDFIDLTGITTGNNNTVSFVAKFAVDATNSYIMDIQTGRIIIGIHTSQNVISYHDGTGWSDSSLVVANSAWHDITVVTKSDGTLQLCVDDNTVYNDTITANSIGGAVNLCARYCGTQDFVKGLMDEVRISNTVRSAAWIKATYYSNWDGLVSFGSEELIETERLNPVNGCCYNVCVNSQHIYKSTVYGVNIYDLDTTSLFNFIGCDYTSSVWVNDDYVYIATSVSGIYRCETSTVTGTVTLEPYKQYPEITSNYVYCIHGCGDYLCATTESGVDHYNLTTGSGVYTTLSGVSKCFQTERGEFYYSYNKLDDDKEIHVVYDNTNNWDIETVGNIYTVVEYNIGDVFAGGWLGTWAKRIKLTVDNTKVDDTLLDFPVLVKLSDSSGISSTDVTSVFTELGSDANRKKIAVTTSDEITQCYAEIERFDYSNSVAELWVKVPLMSFSSETILYLYYDSGQPDNTTYIGDTGDTPAQNVWDSNFKLVMHMAQDPNGDVADAIKDSTSSVNHGTPGGSMTSADLVDGKVGKAIDFDGENDYINCGTDPSINNISDQLTMEGVYKYSINENYVYILSNDRDLAPIGSYSMGPNYPDVRIIGDDDSNYVAGVTLDHLNTWEYLTGTFDGSNVISRVNAVLDNTTAFTGSIKIPASYPLYIGRMGYGYQYTSPITIAEVRISNTARSAGWIKATYYSNWDDLIVFGSEEVYEDLLEYFTINDLYVTEKTSRYNNGNVLFIATSNGVTVIEEKPGEEENSNFKYYYINT